MKYIESYTDYEFTFNVAPAKSEPIMLTIPKKDYTASEQQIGKRRVIEIEDSQLEILMKDETFAGFTKKSKGGYRILDSLPQKYQISSDVIKAKEDKIADLSSQIKDKVSETDDLKKQIADLQKQLSVKETKKKKDA